MLKHGIRFTNDKNADFAKLFRFSLKSHVPIHFVREGVYAVPQTILDQLKDNGIEYELVLLTEDEIQNVRLLSALS